MSICIMRTDLIYPNLFLIFFQLQKLNKVVVIEGVKYKTSSNKLRKTKSPSTRKQSERKVTSLSRIKKTGKLQNLSATDVYH